MQNKSDELFFLFICVNFIQELKPKETNHENVMKNCKNIQFVKKICKKR